MERENGITACRNCRNLVPRRAKYSIGVSGSWTEPDENSSILQQYRTCLLLFDFNHWCKMHQKQITSQALPWTTTGSYECHLISWHGFARRQAVWNVVYKMPMPSHSSSKNRDCLHETTAVYLTLSYPGIVWIYLEDLKRDQPTIVYAALSRSGPAWLFCRALVSGRSWFLTVIKTCIPDKKKKKHVGFLR